MSLSYTDDKLLKVWTDGACSDNQNPDKALAGVGVFFAHGSDLNISEPLKGPKQTNQRAELTAGIRALQTFSCDMLIITDSKHLIGGCTGWLANWKKGNKWLNSKKKPIANKDLWLIIDNLLTSTDRIVKFKWVQGHGEDEGNNEADRLARLGVSLNTLRR